MYMSQNVPKQPALVFALTLVPIATRRASHHLWPVLLLLLLLDASVKFTPLKLCRPLFRNIHRIHETPIVLHDSALYREAGFFSQSTFEPNCPTRSDDKSH